MGRIRTREIRKTILDDVFWSSRSPVKRVAGRFGLTEQAILLHVQQLIADGYILAKGERQQRRYFLKPTYKQAKRYVLTPDTAEHAVWEDFFAPALENLSAEASEICHYGVTEMVNNVIDHAAATELKVQVVLTHSSVELHVNDDGVGVFQKIAEACGLADPRLALLELNKGKFTTDPTRHSGEGIFFTSRVFDKFSIRSSDLLFHHSARDEDWLVEPSDKSFKGTHLTMQLMLPPTRKLQSIFDQFSSGPDDYDFAKTHVQIGLAEFGDESLMSRSSAKRVLRRFERFREVVLDFIGIRSVGQAFADEIFRVFALRHPDVQLTVINANAQVTGMIRRAESAKRDMKLQPDVLLHSDSEE